MIVKKAPTISILIFLLAGATLLGLYVQAERNIEEKDSLSIQEEVQEAEIVSANSKLLFTGETFWGRQYERKRRNAEEGALQFPFSGLETYSKNNYDAWITHLECPVTNAELSFEDEWNAIALNCRPEFLPEFVKWFDIATIGHNHIFDIGGEIGYEETKQNLDEYDIQYFGHFYPSEHSEACEVVTVPIRISLSDNSESEEELPIAMCGYNGVFNLPTQADIDVIKQYSDKFFTVVLPQMGKEYENVSDQLKRETYRSMIDAGADLIAASHPHAVQETEIYNGKLIVYSMGNFIFDQQDWDVVESSVAIDVELDFSSPEQIEQLKSWIELDGCKKQKDKCSQSAKAQLETSDPSLTYDLIPGMQNNLVQSKLEIGDTNIDRILNIAKWPETKNLLEN